SYKELGCVVMIPCGSRTGNDRLELADLAVLEGVRCLPEIVRETASKGQFIKRVNPVRPGIVELPVGVDIRLLHGVVGAHALMNWDDVRLLVGEVVGLTREVWCLPVEGEE